MRIVRTFLSLLALVSTLVEGKSATGQRVLVIVEHAINRADYSQFWDSLQARGFELTFKGPKEETHRLIEYAFADHLKPGRLLPDLLDSGINTLFLSSSEQSDALSSLYREFDLEFSKKHTGLLTHNLSSSFGLRTSSSNVQSHSVVAFPLNEGLHREIPESIIPARLRESVKPVIFSGLTHTPGHLNPFVIPVLHAPRGAFSGDLPRGDGGEGESEYDDDDEEAMGRGSKGKNKLTQVISGEDAGLVSVFQSRSNVRFGWVGGIGMVKDDVWTAETMNPEFISSLTSWVFQETGVVKVLSTEHYRQRESAEGNGTVKETRDRFAGYTVKEDVTYEITLAQHDPSLNNTSGYAPIQIDDLQLDFTMLDPHVRTSIGYAGDIATEQGYRASLYRKTFKVPDRHGVFKFVVDWWRPGYSFIHESSTTSVIPFRHDEYPRFIQGAYPFYAGAFLVSGSFLVFCYLWMHLGIEGDKVGRGNVKEKEGKKSK